MDDAGLLDPDTLKPMDHASQAHVAPVEPMERRGVAAVVPACSSGTAPGRERLQIEAPVSLLGVLHATAQLWTALGRRLLYSPTPGPPPSDVYTPGRPALASSLAARREEQESEGADAALGDDEIQEPRASFGEEWMPQCRNFLLAPVIGFLADFVSRVEFSEKCRLQQQERETRCVISYLAFVLAPAVWSREHKSGAQTLRPALTKLTNVTAGCCEKRSGVSSPRTCPSRPRARGCNGNGVIALPMPWDVDGGAFRCSRSGPRCDEGGCCLRNVPAHYCNVMLQCPIALSPTPLKPTQLYPIILSRPQSPSTRLWRRVASKQAPRPYHPWQPMHQCSDGLLIPPSPRIKPQKRRVPSSTPSTGQSGQPNNCKQYAQQTILCPPTS